MIIARIILIILVVITAGLYVRVLLPPEAVAPTTTAQQPVAEQIPAGTAAPTPAPVPAAQAEPAAAAKPAPAMAAEEAKPMPLPADQMQLVIETLAPEYAAKHQ